MLVLHILDELFYVLICFPMFYKLHDTYKHFAQACGPATQQNKD